MVAIKVWTAVAKNAMRRADRCSEQGRCKDARQYLYIIDAVMTRLRSLNAETPELIAEWRAVLTRYAIANQDDPEAFIRGLQERGEISLPRSARTAP